MKRMNITTTILAAVLVLFFSNSFYAKNGDTTAKKMDFNKSRITENAVKNYARGIESQNDGLRKSAIYFAGVYKIDELVKPLVKQFAKEKDNNVRTLIALALYMIGDEDGIAAVENWQHQ